MQCFMGVKASFASLKSSSKRWGPAYRPPGRGLLPRPSLPNQYLRSRNRRPSPLTRACHLNANQRQFLFLDQGWAFLETVAF